MANETSHGTACFRTLDVEPCIAIFVITSLLIIVLLILAVVLACCVYRKCKARKHLRALSESAPEFRYHSFSEVPRVRESSRTQFGDRISRTNTEGRYTKLPEVDPNVPTGQSRDEAGSYSYASVSQVNGNVTATGESAYDYARVPNRTSEMTSGTESEQVQEDVVVSVEYAQVQDAVFWQPPAAENELYASFEKKKYNVIPKKALIISEVIGQGEFGTVNKGVLRTVDGPLDVAVKTLSVTTEESRVGFLQEAAIIGQFNHKNILKLYGVVLKTKPLQMVLELLPKGDLKQYLENYKVNINRMDQVAVQSKLLQFAKEIAEGMEYLVGKKYVHRDLAARNVLLSSDETCKIGDFGLSRRLVNDFYNTKGGQVPLKWTALEAIEFRTYSSASDVWSYGVVLYEIWSLGEKPYAMVPPMQFIQHLKDGGRLKPPPGCPRPVYQMMMECWHPSPVLRPSFSDILFRFGMNEAALLRLDDSDHHDLQGSKTLGSDLETANYLYMDLQNCYNVNN